MQIFGTLRHHDHDYVERRGGFELLTHLRRAPARVKYRREAIERAYSRFQRAEAEQRPEPECCGPGLLVLQRAVLAAEQEERERAPEPDPGIPGEEAVREARHRLERAEEDA
jgi:hypothetical protein